MVPVCRALARRHFQVAAAGSFDSVARSSYYFSGKGFQKIGSLCLLLEESYGTNHSHTVACVEILAKGFRCLYDPAEADCAGAPEGSYYESEWGGIASKEGFADSGCRTADFGNACYNDHHFHFGRSLRGVIFKDVQAISWWRGPSWCTCGRRWRRIQASFPMWRP